MDRSLTQKALAKGTRRIDLKILDDDDADIVDAEFVDVPVETLPAVIPPKAIVTPGRARRATDAYVPADDRRPIIAIG
jgi:hypothetical protein